MTVVAPHPDCIDTASQINRFVRGERNMTLVKQVFATALAFLLVIATTPLEVQAQQTGYSGQGAPLSGDELQQLVAPIALYPDSLVAQVLGAASYPDQVSAAANWLQQNSNLTRSTSYVRR